MLLFYGSAHSFHLLVCLLFGLQVSKTSLCLFSLISQISMVILILEPTTILDCLKGQLDLLNFYSFPSSYFQLLIWLAIFIFTSIPFVIIYGFDQTPGFAMSFHVLKDLYFE